MIKIEVGKIYKCGDKRVKIVAFEPSHSDGGLLFGTYCYIGLVVGQSGHLCCGGDTDTGFGFFRESGDGCCVNGSNTRHYLEEIVKPVREMTMEQVNEALGFEAKIVGGGT